MRSGSDTAAIRMLDLRLMHHYTAFVAETLCSSKSERIAWQQGVPLLAYDAPYTSLSSGAYCSLTYNSYLMDTILAVSALHLRTLCPNDYSLTRACHGYMASSLAQYSSILGNRAVSERVRQFLCTLHSAFPILLDKHIGMAMNSHKSPNLGSEAAPFAFLPYT